MEDEEFIPEYQIQVERRRPLAFIAFTVLHAIVCKLERIRDDMPDYMEWKTVTVRGDTRPGP